MMNNYSELYGVMTALATPLTTEGKFDRISDKKLINYVLDAGINSIFILGHAGECLAFDRNTRCKIIEAAREEIGKRVPLIVGVFDNSTSLVLQHIHDAKEIGADYVLTTPPNFYTISQSEVRDFYLRLAEEGGMPIIAYNCPGFANSLALPTVAELAEHPMMAGLKETSEQVTLQRMHLLLESNKNFVLLSGDEFLYMPALSIGIKAFIMGGPGNLTPKWCVEIMDNYNKGNIEKARKQYLDMVSFLHLLLETEKNPMATVKAALEILGLCTRHMAHPVSATEENENIKIAALLQKYKII